MELCWFCKKNPPVKSAAINVNLFKILAIGGKISTPALVGLGLKQTNYVTKIVEIPRCEHCKMQQQKESADLIDNTVKSFFLGMITIGIGIGAGFIASSVLKITSTLLCVILGIIVGITVGKILSKLKIFKSDYSANNGKFQYSQFPLIAELLESGWQIGEKPLR